VDPQQETTQVEGNSHHLQCCSESGPSFPYWQICLSMSFTLPRIGNVMCNIALGSTVSVALQMDVFEIMYRACRSTGNAACMPHDFPAQVCCPQTGNCNFKLCATVMLRCLTVVSDRNDSQARQDIQTLVGKSSKVGLPCLQRLGCHGVCNMAQHNAKESCFPTQLPLWSKPGSLNVLCGRTCTSCRSSDCWSTATTQRLAEKPRACTLHPAGAPRKSQAWILTDDAPGG